MFKKTNPLTTISSFRFGKKTTQVTIALSIALCFTSTAVHATNVGAGVTLGGSSSASGGSATGGASSSSSTANSQSNSQGGAGGSAQQGQLQGQVQGIVGSGNSSSGSNTLSNSAGASGNTTTTNVIGGNTEVDRNAPPVMIGTVIQPIGTCRLSVGGGGSNTSGAFAGGFPIGNDETCLVDARDKMMQRLPNIFSELDRTLNICKVEGMSEFEACKNAKRIVEAQ